MTESEVKLRCMKGQCYGVVKEYSSNGLGSDVREPSKYAIKEYGTFKYTGLLILNKYMPGFNKEIKWEECSVCHQYHGLSE